MMLKAEDAKKLSENFERKIHQTIQDVDLAIHEFATLGFSNTNVDVNTKVVGSIAEDLFNRGFKVYYTFSPYKDVTEVEIEWHN